MTLPTHPEYPQSSLRFDWIVSGLSAWIIGGLYLDGWAHNHGKVDDSFFTPWHAALYSGVFVMFIFLFSHQARNVFKGHPLGRALPKGYLLSLIGVALFLLGGLLDLLWHAAFGIELDLEALLSPTHLLLATSGVLMVSGPIRALVSRMQMGEVFNGWKALGPLVLCATFILSILTFFTQFAHPIGYPMAGKLTTIDQGRFSDIYLIHADGTSQIRLTSTLDTNAWGGAWSPDGRQIVFTQSEVKEGQGRAAESALYLMAADGSGIKQLTEMPGHEYLPAWSPEGTRIAFVSSHQQVQQIYAINVDGSHLQQLTDATSPTFGPAWSPDGKKIGYALSTHTSSELYIMNSDGSHPTQLTSNGAYNGGAVWSPDGQQIAFHSSDSENNADIYLINSDGSGEKRLTESPADDYSPTWSPDGRQIAFLSWEDNVVDIYVIDADGINRRKLTHNHALEINSPKWSPDGKTILFSANGHTTLPDLYNNQSLAVAGLLFQSALLMGIVLTLIKNWKLPFGTLTFLFTLNGLLMSVFHDEYILGLSMLGAGLIADSLLTWSKPSTERRERFWLFAFSVPALFCALYFLAVQLTQGIDWAIHLWLGTIFLTGTIGLLVGFLIISPLNTAREH
jgi:TolB protein